jgi:hypothetical protein
MLGNPISDDLVYPFTDTEADQVAAQMGVPPRSPDGTGFGGTGTVFVLIDPVIEPEDVRVAAARYWWPALEQAKLALTVVGYDGTEIPVDPASDPFLADFIDIFHATRLVEDTSLPDIDLDDHLTEWDWIHKFRKKDEQEFGRIGLRANAGWSWQSTTESGERRLTMVALVRKTGMVVEYRISGGRRISTKDPFLRGVFVADVAANDALRRTEPPLHDRWKTDPDEDEARIEKICRAYEISNTIQHRINEDVKAFKAELEPPSDDSVDPVTLPILAKALSGPSGRTPPPPKKDRVEIIGQKHTRVEVPGKDQLMKVESTYTIGLQDSAKFSEADASVKFVYNTYEDDKVGSDSCVLDITAPTGFSSVPTPEREADLVDSDGRARVVMMPKWYEFHGKVRKGKTEEFTVVTHPFHKNWTLKPRIIYRAVDSAAAAQGTEVSNDANEDNG